MKCVTGQVHQRGAMGEYAGKEKNNLTALAMPIPGPSDYTPQMTQVKKAAEEWSLVGKPKDVPVPVAPPPTQYDTNLNLSWKDKTVSLKEKGKVCCLGPRHDVHITVSKGPASYYVKHGDTGKNSIKHSIGLKSKTALSTMGHDAPGATFLGQTDRGESFSLAPKIPVNSETDGPGPAGYAAPKSVRGQHYSLGGKVDNELASSTDITLPRFFGWNVGYTPFRKTNVEDSPGPAYNLKTTVGDGSSRSISWRQSVHIGKDGKVPAWPGSIRRAPTPGSYTMRFTDKPSHPKHTLGYCSIEPTDTKEPGPGHYQGFIKEKPKKAYTFGVKSVPTYPQILNYIEHSKTTKAPQYYCAPNNFANNNSQKAVIGHPLKDPICTIPAPNKYSPSKATGHIPQCSITSRIKISDDNKVPGPGSYNIKTGASTPKYTMAGRPKPRRVDTTPAPNAYTPRKSNSKSSTKGGITMKGRPSPFVYSGFRNTSRSSTLVS